MHAQTLSQQAIVSPRSLVPLQMDFLEHPMVKDVIIMSVVLEEVKHRNQSIYQRLRALCASEERRFFVFANEHHRWGCWGIVRSQLCTACWVQVHSTRM